MSYHYVFWGRSYEVIPADGPQLQPGWCWLRPDGSTPYMHVLDGGDSEVGWYGTEREARHAAEEDARRRMREEEVGGEFQDERGV